MRAPYSIVPRLPYRHASSASTVGLPPPRARGRRTPAASSVPASQSAPDDLRYAASAVHAKLEALGLTSEGASPALAILLSRLYDRSHAGEALGKLGVLRQ